MTSKILTRSYLQGIQTQLKQQYLERVVNSFIPHIENAAINGETNYYCDIDNIKINFANSRTKPPNISCKEFVRAFQYKLPDCDISFVMDEQKNGIMVDWV